MRGYATNSAGTTYGTVFSLTTGYGIGESFAGGIIFYIYNTKVHGLVVAATDQGSAKWDNTNGGTFLSPSAYSTTDGAGNTAKIYNAAGNNGNAAALCRTYRGGGYAGWFLPSSGQLTQVFNQTAALYTNTAMKPFAADYYWTSTESTSYIAFALCVQMYTGTLYSDFKINGYPVRAIRAF